MTNEELRTAAQIYETPFYIYDADQLSERISQIRERLGTGIGLCYAMKANPFLTSAMSRLADRVEVCSPGEMRICIRRGIPAGKILMSGVNKHLSDIYEALAYGVTSYTAESLKHMRLLAQAAAEKGAAIRVYLRLSSGTQFGMSSDDVAKILHERQHYGNCEICGLHYFTGTQRKAGRRHQKDVKIILEALARFEKECAFIPEEIEYGPGLYVPYFEDEPEDDPGCLDTLAEILRDLTGRYKVTVETGRYFTAACGYYFTGIDDIKKTDGTSFAIVDGGIHQVNYYGGNMGLRVPRLLHIRNDSHPEEASSDEAWCVCGSLCTTADVLLRAAPLKDVSEGDILVFKNTGAYSITESSALFLCRDMPKIMIKENGRIYLARPALDSSMLITGNL